MPSPARSIDECQFDSFCKQGGVSAVPVPPAGTDVMLSTPEPKSFDVRSIDGRFVFSRGTAPPSIATPGVFDLAAGAVATLKKADPTTRSSRRPSTIHDVDVPGTVPFPWIGRSRGLATLINGSGCL
jgi:hypothetical protein